jgi:hypothetical protein
VRPQYAISRIFLFVPNHPLQRGIWLVTPLKNLLLVRYSDDPPVINLKAARIVCDSELGGHLKSYRAAA